MRLPWGKVYNKRRFKIEPMELHYLKLVEVEPEKETKKMRVRGAREADGKPKDLLEKLRKESCSRRDYSTIIAQK